MTSNTAVFIWMAAIVALWYFMWFRPQQKQRRAQSDMLSSLKVGDKVMTAGGLYGTLRAVDEDTVELEVADGVVVRFAKGAIAKVEPPQDVADE